eukprot:gene25021-30522_t
MTNSEAPDVITDTMSGKSLPPLSLLKCGVCRDYFNNPITLPCLHSMCEGCVPRNDPALDERKAFIHCPKCNEQPAEILKHAATTGDVPVVPDVRLSRIVQLILHSKHLCDNCGELAELTCETCANSFCRTCFDRTHAFEVFKNHKSVPLAHADMSRLPDCPQHGEGQPLEFWCTVCKVGVCQVCLLKGSHKGHHYLPIAEVRQTSYEDMKLTLRNTKNYKAALEVAVENVECEKQKLDGAYELVTKAIEVNFAAIQAAVAQRKDALLSDSLNLFNLKLETLEKEKSSLETELDRTNEAIGRAEAVVAYSNDLELVNQKSLVSTRLSAVTASPVPTKCEEGNMHVALFDHLSTAIAGYGAIKGNQSTAEIAHKKQLQGLVNEADKILSKRVVNTSAKAKAPPPTADGPKSAEEMVSAPPKEGGCVLQ